MNFSDYINKFKLWYAGLSLVMKILVGIVLPLGLIFIIAAEAGKFFSGILDSYKRGKVDDAAAKAAAEEEAAKKAAGEAQTKVEDLQKAKDDAVKSTGDDDPVKFHNGR